MSEKDQILADLERLRAGFRERFAAAKTEQALRDENAKILGKKGELTAILKQMGKVAARRRARRSARRSTRSSRRSRRPSRRASRALAQREARGRARRAAVRSHAPRARARAARARASDLDRARRGRRRSSAQLGFAVLRRAGGRARGEQLHQARLPAGSPGDRHAGQLLDDSRATSSARTRATSRSAR